MNFEVKPFYEYESIILNDIKDQTNSLLNLVTEELRPLHVSLKNGKEFLMIPQDILAPFLDPDFHLVLIAAMRYAMGRNTYMPLAIADYIKRHIQLLEDKFIILAADDIQRYFEDYGEHEPNPNLWQELWEVLEAQRRERVCRPTKKVRLCPICGKPLEVMRIVDNKHSPGGFDVIAHCWNCGDDFEWFCDKDGGVSEMKRHFFE